MKVNGTGARGSNLKLLTVTLLTALVAVAPAVQAFETDVLTRDPSTIVKRDGTYWVYGTGEGAQQFSSTDRIHWTRRGPVFATAPAWVAGAVPANTHNNVWAPDIHFFGGKYYLYYSYSTMGSKISGIGVASNATLDPRGWVDGGVAIQSTPRDNFNPIDPCIFQDAEGKPWLSFGSYFSGIHLIQIDPNTGKRISADSPIYNLATRPTTPGNAIEASAVYYHNGYYYLFVNWDGCCAGAKSSYNIRMGRSQTVTGPYLDKTGKDLMQGGGSLFLAAVYDNGSGRPIDDETGPGHVGILQDTDGYWVSTHYEWARDREGATTMNLNKLAWDADGWPRAVLDAGPYKIVSALATHDVVAVAGGATSAASLLQTEARSSAPGQQWTLRYVGDGYYNVLGVGNRLALSVAGCNATPGARIELDADQNRECQQWYLQQNDDGTYCLLTKNSQKAQALDVSGCSPLDGAPLQQWTANGLDCQKWSLRVR